MKYEYIHKEKSLHFYRYIGGNRVYASDSIKDEDITEGEFGFINEDRSKFKLTEDVCLTKEQLEAILFMMNWKGL